MQFFDQLSSRILLFDGAMGTEIQKIAVQDNEWDGYNGCNEILTISAAHHISGIHRAYLEAGADVIETNTFGANRIVLAEYGLEDRTVELNRAAARLAAGEKDNFSAEKPLSRPLFVAGSMGPGTKLPSLGQVDFDTIHYSYLEQARGLIEGGVDLFIVETAQDLLQIKSAVIAIQDAMSEAGLRLPIIVSVTVETNGSLLVGSDIPAVVTALSPLGVDILGINCATGPKEMRPHIRELSAQFDGPVFSMPNAGFPSQKNGQLVYDLGSQDYADTLTSFVTDFGVDIIGGCCGTTPEYIAELRRRIPYLQKGARPESPYPSDSSSRAGLASLYSRQELHQEPAPFFVGERTNTNGSKKFRSHLLEDDWDSLVAMGKQQLKTGAHGLDVCVAYTGRDEQRDMYEVISRMTTSVDLPLVIDSTSPEVIEAALKLIGGRALINSINLENGEHHAGTVFQLAKRYGAAIIALTIDEEGMAKDVEGKVAIARRIVQFATEKFGLKPEDLVIDPLTFTLGSGDKSLEDAGTATIEALRRIKKELPGVHTILGVSNISFGLSPDSREVLNSVFLSEAVEAGLDLAIVNVRKIIPVFQIPEEERKLALNLIYNRGSKQPLMDYINFFQAKIPAAAGKEHEEKADQTPETRLKEAVLDGDQSELKEILDSLLKQTAATAIINEQLIPAMKEVGELFGEGKIQLPFVLQSAEVMKRAVDILEPYIEKKDQETGKTIVLATVRGDVHDIGKNLVDIILSNNGYHVHNLGIKVDIETIIEKAQALKADAIGMSGLLVKSTAIMRSNIEEMKAQNIDLPVLLGGAALTRDFVQEDCDPLLKSPVYYCRDAFDGLKAMNEIVQRSGKVKSEIVDSEQKSAGNSKPEHGRKGDAGPSDAATLGTEKTPEGSPEGSPEALKRQAPVVLSSIDIPQPDDFERHELREIDPQELFDRINLKRLFRGRWGYRKGAGSEAEYQRLEKEEILPAYHALKDRIIKEKIITARSVYRLFPCVSQEERVLLLAPDSREVPAVFSFPRQKGGSRLSVADFFQPQSSGHSDVIGLQLVTLGSEVVMEIQRLFREHNYRDYLHLHGLAVELTEILAEYTQEQIEIDLWGQDTQGENLKGTRYSFGYACCPDLSTNRELGRLLEAEKLGVEFTEDDQMVPEFSTSGFISFHPEAHYF